MYGLSCLSQLESNRVFVSKKLTVHLVTTSFRFGIFFGYSPAYGSVRQRVIRSAVSVRPLGDLSVVPEWKILAKGDVVGVCKDLSVVEVGPALAKLGVGHAMAS